MIEVTGMTSGRRILPKSLETSQLPQILEGVRMQVAEIKCNRYDS